MATSLKKADVLFVFARLLATQLPFFTLPQLSRHPYLADRKEPVKRASAILKQQPDVFEAIPGRFGEPFRFRFTGTERKKQKLGRNTVDPGSQHSNHWLALGDLFISLALYSFLDVAAEPPKVWINEPNKSAGFDVFFVWKNIAYLAEVQRTNLTENEWKKKWESRLKWLNEGGYKKAPWQPKDRIIRPEIVLVANQKSGAAFVPGTIYIPDIQQAGRILLNKRKEQRTSS